METAVLSESTGWTGGRRPIRQAENLDQKTEKRILALLDADPPEGYSQWNGPLIAQRLQDVSDDQVWRVLRKHKIQLQRRRSWCISTDPTSSSLRSCAACIFLLAASQHIHGHHITDAVMQAHILLNQWFGVLLRQRCARPDAFALQRSMPALQFSARLRVVRQVLT
jgi:hypothetical protein